MRTWSTQQRMVLSSNEHGIHESWSGSICFRFCARQWHDLLSPWWWVHEASPIENCAARHRSSAVSVCSPVCVTEDLKNRLFTFLVTKQAWMHALPFQRDMLVRVTCHVANQVLQDHHRFVHGFWCTSWEISDHVLALWQIWRQVQRIPMQDLYTEASSDFNFSVLSGVSISLWPGERLFCKRFDKWSNLQADPNAWNGFE